jgi:hypothetical protein
MDLPSAGFGAVAFVLAALSPCPWSRGAAAQEASLEYAVKATYLYKFAPFVEWPPGAFATATSPVEICVVGDDPFGPTLDRALEGQRVGERAFALRRLGPSELPVSCHVAYLAATGAQPVAETLRAVAGAPVLTVTNEAVSPRAKGIVNFVLREGRVRFEIDNRAAAEAGIAISSKLLGIAVAVRGRE